MIGKMEAVATWPRVVGIFQGREYTPMSEYAPQSMLHELCAIRNRDETCHYTVVDPECRVERNTQSGRADAYWIYPKWVANDKLDEVVARNKDFYEKLKAWQDANPRDD